MVLYKYCTYKTLLFCKEKSHFVLLLYIKCAADDNDSCLVSFGAGAKLQLGIHADHNYNRRSDAQKPHFLHL